MATLTGFEPTSEISLICAITAQAAVISVLTALCENERFSRIAQNNAVRVSEFVRKAWHANPSANRGKWWSG